MQTKQAIWTLILGEFFDRLNFYGIQSILILYLIQNTYFSKHHVLTIYGAYSSLGFILPIVGGFVVDKFLLNRYKIILVGLFFILCGDIVLFLSPEKIFLFGISLVIIGVSFFKSNNAVLFGLLHNQTSPQKKDAAFTYYYAAMNAGAIAGPVIYGSINIAFGWRNGILVTIVGFSINFIFYCLSAKYLQTNKYSAFKKNNFGLFKGATFSLFLLGLIYLCLYYNYCLLFLLFSSVILVSSLCIYIIKHLPHLERKKMFLLIVSMCYGIFFYALSLQISSSLLLYINAAVNTKVMGLIIPPQYFMSVSSVCILILTPISARIWKSSSVTGKVSLIYRVNLSIYLASFSFLLIAISALLNKSVINEQLLLIILSLAILGFGELSIGPVITSAVTYLAPLNQQGIFMGVWYLCIGYSAYLSSLMAEIISSQHQIISYGNIYFQNFLLIALFALIIAISMTLVRKPLSNLYLN